ncbi:MAG: DUF3999 family protein, partial [Variovorax sp.]
MRKPFLIRCALPLLIAAHGVAQAEPSANFAAVELKGGGPYYRLDLPLAIHGLAAHGDLSDVRVVNAAGHAVPHAWLRDEAVMPRLVAQDVPIYALPHSEGAAPAYAVLAIKVQPDGSLALSGKAPRPT